MRVLLFFTNSIAQLWSMNFVDAKVTFQCQRLDLSASESMIICKTQPGGQIDRFAFALISQFKKQKLSLS